MIRIRRCIQLLFVVLLLCMLSVGGTTDERLRIATTTSLYDTKLLDVLESRFEEEHGVALDIISGGTGFALEQGRRGDVDLLLVHDKDREREFIDDGYGTERRCFAYNYFYIVGPAGDPAGIRGRNASEAFRRIADAGEKNPNVQFVSRGDNSGTHARERMLWKSAGIEPSGRWYLESGQGMGATLIMADEKRAYTLTDMSTYMAFAGNLSLVPLVTESDELLNVYAAIPVSASKHLDLAERFVEFLLSQEGQEIIAGYGKDIYGRALFYPAAGHCTEIGCNATECPGEMVSAFG
ncbi:MAG TPA: substrate-binding domain-containing protein [Methanothrix sp.]|nr:substrate-binding domain-containing protein [Methanothrix sp.]HOK58064.1 substrate-binding domain-containing protein [Methanothrix sp.]HOL43467.1 substrate-binding domain-containing protein [Methanothrix sp.]HPO88515.1 substrate-binding domain-containing protein [Methanothrix sp.]